MAAGGAEEWGNDRRGPLTTVIGSALMLVCWADAAGLSPYSPAAVCRGGGGVSIATGGRVVTISSFRGYAVAVCSAWVLLLLVGDVSLLPGDGDGDSAGVVMWCTGWGVCELLLVACLGAHIQGCVCCYRCLCA